MRPGEREATRARRPSDPQVDSSPVSVRCPRHLTGSRVAVCLRKSTARRHKACGYNGGHLQRLQREVRCLPHAGAWFAASREHTRCLPDGATSEGASAALARFGCRRPRIPRTHGGRRYTRHYCAKQDVKASQATQSGRRPSQRLTALPRRAHARHPSHTGRGEATAREAGWGGWAGWGTAANRASPATRGDG